MYELNAYGWYTGRDKYEDAVHQAIWMRDHCVHKTDYEVRKALKKEYKKYGVLDDPYLCIIWAIAFSKRSGVYEFLKRKAIEGVKREKLDEIATTATRELRKLTEFCDQQKYIKNLCCIFLHAAKYDRPLYEEAAELVKLSHTCSSGEEFSKQIERFFTRYGAANGQK